MLLESSSKGFSGIVEFLLQNGADANIADEVSIMRPLDVIKDHWDYVVHMHTHMPRPCHDLHLLMGWLDLSKPHTIEMNCAFSPSAIQRCHFVCLHSNYVHPLLSSIYVANRRGALL